MSDMFVVFLEVVGKIRDQKLPVSTWAKEKKSKFYTTG